MAAFGPRSTTATAEATSRNPTRLLAPEQAEATCTRNASLPVPMANVMPSPLTGVASRTMPTATLTAAAVSLLSGSSSMVTPSRAGTGQARNSQNTATLVRQSIRIPKRSATTPATNSGSTSRSIRQSQNMVDMRAGSSAIDTTGTASSGTAAIRSRWRSWISGSSGLGRDRTSARPMATNGTRPR